MFQILENSVSSDLQRYKESGNRFLASIQKGSENLGYIEVSVPDAPGTNPDLEDSILRLVQDLQRRLSTLLEAA